MTAGYITGDTGFARLFRMPKWGDGNTPGVAHAQPKSHVIRIIKSSAGNQTAVATTLTLKHYSRSDGTPQVTVTADAAILDGLEVYVEDTATHWVLVALTRNSGDRVTAEFLSPQESGLVEPIVNEPFTYTPTGHLIKPMLVASRRLPTTATAAQWLKVATITTRAQFSRYSALFVLAETEAINANTTANLFSLQLAHHPLTSPPTVALWELTSHPRKTFEVHYVTGAADNVGTTEVWVKSDVAFTTLNLTVLSEAGFWADAPAGVQYHHYSAWTGAAPAGAVRAGSQSLVESSLAFSNGWAAASGYGNTTSTGIVVSGRMAHLNMTVTGGTMTDNTTIATVNSAFVPKSNLDVMALVTDASGAHSLGRLVIYPDGTIRILGATLAGNAKVTAQASWRIPNF